MGEHDNIDLLMKTGILEAIMNASTDGFTYTDETGYIVFNNRAYNEITGLPQDRILNNNIHVLVKDGYPVSRMALEVFKTRKKKTELIKYQADSERTVMVTVAPVYDNKGEFRGVVGNLRDMTELMELRQKLNVTYLEHDKELQAKEAANRDLINHINEMLHLMEDYDLVGKSKQMHNLAELALRVSHVKSTVLITGESGVGKDVFCQMVSRFSSGKGYIKISCGTIPENLLESELFGYEPGSFTGASKSGKRGIFEIAGDGVIFLDEIGEMPLRLQVKLLTVLQDRQFFRIGGTHTLPMNAHIIAATNRDLKQEVEKGAFRQDLYYRLNVIPVHIPPLRERKEDIIAVAQHILDSINKHNNTTKVLDSEVQRCFLAYDWPGNIRELSNVVERMYVMTDGDVLEAKDIPEEILAAGGIHHLPSPNASLKTSIEHLEAKIISRKLEEELPLRDIAVELGINVSTLVRKMNKYRLSRRGETSAASDCKID